MPTSDADLAIAAAEAGAAVVRSMYRKPLERLAKSPTDFATTADIEAEKAILNVLRSARPDEAVLGEESGSSGPESAGRRWLVDPMCGTPNFAAETPLAAVNVALRAGCEIVAAATADPVAGEVFWTDGVKTWLRYLGSDTLAAPSAQSHIVDVNLDPPFPNGFRPAQLLGDAQFALRQRYRALPSSWLRGVTGLRGEPLDSGATGLVAAADKTVHARLLGLVARCHEDRAT